MFLAYLLVCKPLLSHVVESGLPQTSLHVPFSLFSPSLFSSLLQFLCLSFSLHLYSALKPQLFPSMLSAVCRCPCCTWHVLWDPRATLDVQGPGRPPPSKGSCGQEWKVDTWEEGRVLEKDRLEFWEWCAESFSVLSSLVLKGLMKIISCKHFFDQVFLVFQ